MDQDLDLTLDTALEDVTRADSLDTLEGVRVRYLGKKGKITTLLKTLGNMPLEERKSAGEKINAAKQKVQNAIKEQKVSLENQKLNQQLQQELIDVSICNPTTGLGSTHPISISTHRIHEYFTKQGFELKTGPEIEDDFHNFEALNIPPHHPARAMQDTFYFPDGHLLRTHTSGVQIRSMINSKPPLKIVATGRVYRCDSDATHTPMFHQLETFMVDKNVNFSHLKWILTDFLSYFFETNINIRMRPSYFPFTEPSVEVDMTCVNCNGRGCKICSHSGWIEILGAGMIHPNVLTNCSIDPTEYSGFAFGIGIDRITMLYYNIPDLRMLFENDLNLLEQFS